MNLKICGKVATYFCSGNTKHAICGKRAYAGNKCCVYASVDKVVINW